MHLIIDKNIIIDLQNQLGGTITYHNDKISYNKLHLELDGEIYDLFL